MGGLIASAARRFRNIPAAGPLAVVLLITCAARAILLDRPPAIYPDTHGYVSLAHNLRTLRFAGYDGTRPPIYPLFLLLTGMNFYVVRFLQNLLGMAIAAMLFAMVYRRTQSAALALVAGVVYGVDMSQLGLEQYILTETLSTFLLTLSVVVFQWMVLKGKFGWREQATLGTLVAVTGLTRPIYVCLAPLYFAFLAMMGPRAGVARADRNRHPASFAAPTAALLLGWCVFNWLTLGYFGLTTLTGFNLSNHSGAFIELAPDRYARIRDPYLRARPEQIAEQGTHSMTIFRADGEIYRETGYNRVQLSRALTRMSLELFAEHPILYGRGVGRAWVAFWRPSLYWGSRLTGKGLERPFKYLWTIELWTLPIANLGFLLYAGYLMLRLLLRQPVMGFDLCVIAMVLTVSVLQALLEFGENSRYSAPTSPLVFYTVMVSIWHLRPIRTAAKA